VPDSTPALLRFTPGGRAPDSLNVEAGVAEADTVKVPGEPLMNVVALAVVIMGGVSTVSGDEADMEMGSPSSVPVT
jgi:hypothetical protein